MVATIHKKNKPLDKSFQVAVIYSITGADDPIRTGDPLITSETFLKSITYY